MSYKKQLAVLFGVVILIFSMTACDVTGETYTPSESITNATETLTATVTVTASDVNAISINLADIIVGVKQSVVAINTEVITYDIFNRPVRQEGAGSGWIIDKDGYIVTNNHVIEGARTINVTLDNGQIVPANVVGTDPFTDIAVMKIEAKNLPVAMVGDSVSLRVGDWVIAIGNSLGQGISATNGIVSRKEVEIPVDTGQTLNDLIQTNAAINPGNSGGPLVNMAGEVIGITSVKIAQVGVEGMGYAISTNEAIPIIQSLITTGYVIRPWLGVSLGTANQLLAQQYELAVEEGAFVGVVVLNSPADKAGLKVEDVIVSMDGQEISSAQELIRIIHSIEIGQEVEITFWRGKTKNTTTTVLIEKPPP